MAKKRHKKRKKLSRRQRREQGPQPVASQPSGAAPEPEAEPLTGDQPEVEAAQEEQVVTAKFTPSAPKADHGVDAEIERVEYPAVRRDLRKLGITIVVLILAVIGIVIWNDHSDVVGHIGNWLFSFWQ